MGYSVTPLDELIEQLARLPGIGRKTASRLAYHILNMPNDTAEDFLSAIHGAREKITYCSLCQNMTDGEICAICGGSDRKKDVICVVEEPKDVVAIERTREFSGLYHVLHGAISPMNGITPNEIKIKELMARVAKGDIKEIILATNASVEGEATAMYIAHLAKPFGVRATRLAYGLPVGSDLEYADEVTLVRALEGRQEL